MYRQAYNASIDTMVNSLTDRFDQEDFKLYSRLEQLVISAASQQNFDELFKEVP